jgi:hypothetical protein
MALSHSDDLLLGVKQPAFPMARNICGWLGRDLGDIGWLLKNWAGQRVWRLQGSDWTIGFTGDERSCSLIQQRFFDEPVDVVPHGRVGLLGISALTREWLDRGIDLVICELSRSYRARWSAPIQFSVPSWLNQILAIPESPREYLKGKGREHVRRRVTRFENAGFTYRFTQSREDFDYFYYRMYRPLVSERHGQLASVARYPKQYEQFFSKGGLIQILDKGRPVAGSICLVNGDTCHAIEAGVLDADRELIQRGVNVFMMWCVMVWGAKHGARILNLGGTRPFTSDGVFEFKRGCGARVAQRQRPYSVFSFRASAIRPELAKRINELGVICEIDDGFGVVRVLDHASSWAVQKVADIDEAGKSGLEGVLFLDGNGCVRPSGSPLHARDTRTKKRSGVVLGWSERWGATGEGLGTGVNNEDSGSADSDGRRPLQGVGANKLGGL